MEERKRLNAEFARQWMSRILGLLVAAAASNGATADPAVRILNPYSNVNWATYGTFKANLHTHTTNSDGSMATSAVIDAYKSKNYDMLAITDHDKVTYPWTTQDRDPAAVGMLDIEGNELSQGHHIVSLFSSFTSSSDDANALLAGVAASNGIALFAHPGRYTNEAAWYATLYQAHPHCIGQEIYNQGERYPADRAKWDQVLSLLMPDRTVWGFSNDDAHEAEHIGRNRTYLLLPSLNSANARSALVRGEFYATYSSAGDHIPPAITNIMVDETAGTITVGGIGYTQVVWISQGHVVGTGETLDLINTPGVARYVRTELWGDQGITFSNPFGLLPAGNHAPALSAKSN